MGGLGETKKMSGLYAVARGGWTDWSRLSRRWPRNVPEVNVIKWEEIILAPLDSKQGLGLLVDYGLGIVK